MISFFCLSVVMVVTPNSEEYFFIALFYEYFSITSPCWTLLQKAIMVVKHELLKKCAGLYFSYVMLVTSENTLLPVPQCLSQEKGELKVSQTCCKSWESHLITWDTHRFLPWNLWCQSWAHDLGSLLKRLDLI